MEYRVAHPNFYSGNYIESSSQMDLLSSDGRSIIGTAERTGISDGYHPVYRLRIGFEFDPQGLYGYSERSYAPGYWIWDGQTLMESHEWRATYHAYLPAVAAACAQRLAAMQADMSDLPLFAAHDAA